MSRLLVAFFLLVSAGAAQAAPLGDVDKAALAGEWRAGACAGEPIKGDARFTLEFALTGGQIFVDDPGAVRLMLGVKSVDGDSAGLVLAFQTGSSWGFKRLDKTTLVSDAPPSSFAGLKGLTFHRCKPPADRSALKLEADAVDFFSVMMPPDYPSFIEAHAKGGCKARDYGYLSIDLVGPEHFAVTRGNLHSTRTPAKGVPSMRLDDEQTWAIDAAEELPSVVRLTITPLTGPGHVRGTPTKISLVPGEESGLLTIPEWDAVYRRCTIRDLAGPND
jgi:hypothetical protein